MLRSFEQACNPVDATDFDAVQVLGILTPESQLRHKPLSINLTQIHRIIE